MKRNVILTLLFVLALMVSLAPALQAQDRDSIVNSMKDRYPALLDAKNKGYIGEAWNGLVGVVNPDAPAGVKAVANGENSDRVALFRIIAEETSTPLEEVARQNRIRMYRLAEGSHFLQDQNRQWIRKQDLQ